MALWPMAGPDPDPVAWLWVRQFGFFVKVPSTDQRALEEYFADMVGNFTLAQRYVFQAMGAGKYQFTGKDLRFTEDPQLFVAPALQEVWRKAVRDAANS